MARPAKPNGGVAERNPERTRERILSSALQEFAANGFAGARVDAIARRAAKRDDSLHLEAGLAGGQAPASGH
jgi:AcrR family transcriptional regulator